MVTKRLLEIAERTVRIASRHRVDQAQAVTFFLDSALTRYANSQIHQNVASKKGGALIKVIIDKRIGTLRVNSLEKKQIEDAVGRAVKIAKVTPPNKDFKSLPKPQKWQLIKETFDKKTAKCTPDFRAQVVKEAIDTAHSESKMVNTVAGSFSTGSYEFAVANSLGISAWAQISATSLQTTVIAKTRGSQGFGSSEQHSRRIHDIDPARVAAQAAEKSVASVNPKNIPVGEYEVVLSARAVSTLLMFLGYIGFSATTYQDGQSFVKYHLGKQVFDDKLNVKDDARDRKALYAFPIDGEGVPKKRLQLIEDGKVSEKSICYDSFTAGKEGKTSTGHAFPPIFEFLGRPMPLNVVVAAGDASEEEMIRETKRGIFITRFHYTNPVEPTKAILTGLTRDGTFLIEKGEISKPVMNLRYTDSMLSALKTIALLGKKREIVEEIVTPAMKLEKLRFTGITKY